MRKFLAELGYTLVVTSDKDGEVFVVDRDFVDADYIFSQPFFASVRIRRADGKGVELDMRITAGVGSDHVDLAKAVKRNINVCEVRFFCNSISASGMW